MDDPTYTSVPGNKKSNFSDEEMSCLLEEFGENASVLQGRLQTP